MPAPFPLSVLDQPPISEGSSGAKALRNTIDTIGRGGAPMSCWRRRLGCESVRSERISQAVGSGWAGSPTERDRALIRRGHVYNVLGMARQLRSEAAAGASALLATVSWPKELLPVDPVYVGLAIGVEVINAPLDEDILGALIKHPGEPPKILINEKDGENRRRFTCAHELGHFVRRSPSWSAQPAKYMTLEAGEAETYETVDLRSQASSEKTDDEEFYANEFAACLLMPEDKVRAAAKEEALGQLASRFGVSTEAMAFRLKNLKLDETSDKKRLLPLG